VAFDGVFNASITSPKFSTHPALGGDLILQPNVNACKPWLAELVDPDEVLFRRITTNPSHVPHQLNASSPVDCITIYHGNAV